MSTRPDPRPDLNAAHSMDSVWFVVDANGEVFSMDTGENGGIPSALEAQSDAGFALSELLHGEDVDTLGDFTAHDDAPFFYVRVGDRAPVRWEDLPELLRAEAGCLRLPVAVRGTDAINLAEYLHPDRMDFWGDLEGFLELEPDDPRIIELRRRYARPEDDDEAPGWVFPEPSTPGEVVASQRKPRPTSKAAPGGESSGAAPGPGGAEPGPKASWWARWLGLWRGKT